MTPNSTELKAGYQKQTYAWLRKIPDFFWELLEHKWNVFLFGLKLNVPIWLLILHDCSKFNPQEFIPYCKLEAKALKRNSEEFEIAWLRHHGINKHHWEYWVSPRLKGNIVLPMPNIYLRELLADWWATGKKFGNNPFDYYEKNKNKFQLHPETRMKLEYYLTVYNL